MLIYGYDNVAELFQDRFEKGESLLCTVTTQVIVPVKNDSYFYKYRTKEIAQSDLGMAGKRVDEDNFLFLLEQIKNELLRDTMKDINSKKMIRVQESKLIATDRISEVQLVVQ